MRPEAVCNLGKGMHRVLRERCGRRPFVIDPFPRSEAAATRRAAERGLEIVTENRLVKSKLCNPSVDIFPYDRRNLRTPIDLIYGKKFIKVSTPGW